MKRAGAVLHSFSNATARFQHLRLRSGPFIANAVGNTIN